MRKWTASRKRGEYGVKSELRSPQVGTLFSLSTVTSPATDASLHCGPRASPWLICPPTLAFNFLREIFLWETKAVDGRCHTEEPLTCPDSCAGESTRFRERSSDWGHPHFTVARASAQGRDPQEGAHIVPLALPSLTSSKRELDWGLTSFTSLLPFSFRLSRREFTGSLWLLFKVPLPPSLPSPS